MIHTIKKSKEYIGKNNRIKEKLNTTLKLNFNFFKKADIMK